MNLTINKHLYCPFLDRAVIPNSQTDELISVDDDDELSPENPSGSTFISDVRNTASEFTRTSPSGPSNTIIRAHASSGNFNS